ncbi:uncharacterized membrane protein (DUF485 family) [Flavobacterium sp. PL11]|nr:uncharacterized membrane protein (DUF485 family) [Flavobacterium sp. PL11]
MLDNILNNVKKKSLKERFLLVIALLFFVLYFVLGLFVIFMKNFPFDLSVEYRILFGILLIVYSIFRCFRIINDTKD